MFSKNGFKTQIRVKMLSSSLKVLALHKYLKPFKMSTSSILKQESKPAPPYIPVVVENDHKNVGSTSHILANAINMMPSVAFIMSISNVVPLVL